MNIFARACKNTLAESKSFTNYYGLTGKGRAQAGKKASAGRLTNYKDGDTVCQIIRQLDYGVPWDNQCLDK
jgi:hypothetical protein